MCGLKVLLLENNSVGARVANMPSLHGEKEGIRKSGTGRIGTIPQRVSLIKKHPIPVVWNWKKFPFGKWLKQRNYIQICCYLLVVGHITGSLHPRALGSVPLPLPQLNAEIHL